MADVIEEKEVGASSTPAESAENAELAAMLASKKKKKPAAKKEAESTADGDSAAAADPTMEAFIGELKKKKKKKKKEGEAEKPEEGAEASDKKETENAPRADGEYTYKEMLERVYAKLRQAGGIDISATKRYTLKPPNVVRDGSKKVAFTNFMDICKSMNRPHEHVLTFIYAELQTTGAIDGNECLILRGKFNARNIEGLLRKYINEYVLCAMCHALDTTLTKDQHTRLYQLQCGSCGASRTVQAISSGYHAQVGKRKKT